MNDTPHPQWAIGVFAHNEAASISACLDSLFIATQHPDSIHIYVLNNGSTDNTATVVSAYAKKHPCVQLVEIKKGDKANAWNYFVHELAPQADLYGFVDGDVTVSPQALDALAVALQQNPQAHIASGVPYSGRHVKEQHYFLDLYSGVQGNLYAARARFIQEIQQKHIRMPFGFIREDGLVGAFAMYSLDPLSNEWDKSRVVPVAAAGFIFTSLRWWNSDDIHLYWRRRIRYSIGHFQNILIRDLMQKTGLTNLPADIIGLYRSSALPKLKYRGMDTLFDAIALYRIKKVISQDSQRPT